MGTNDFAKRTRTLPYFISLFVLVALCTFSLPAQAEIKTVAVGNFIDTTNSLSGVISGITIDNTIYDNLKKNKNYSVVKLSELPNASYANYTLSGKIFNVQIIPFDFVVYAGIKAKVAIEMNVVDNRTGKIIMAETVYGTASAATEERFLLKESFSPNEQALIIKACVDASNVILARMDYMNPLIGKVLKANLEEKIIYFDIGTDDNAKKGDKYVVFEEGMPLTNPETGEFIAIEDKILAEVKIKDIKSNYARAKITDRYGEIKKGAKVKKLHEY